MRSILAIEFLKHSNEFVRWGATIGPFLMGLVTGSGDAAAIAFNTAVTPHALELGYTHVNLGMAAAITGAIGRTASSNCWGNYSMCGTSNG